MNSVIKSASGSLKRAKLFTHVLQTLKALSYYYMSNLCSKELYSPEYIDQILSHTTKAINAKSVFVVVREDVGAIFKTHYQSARQFADGELVGRESARPFREGGRQSVRMPRD